MIHSTFLSLFCVCLCLSVFVQPSNRSLFSAFFKQCLIGNFNADNKTVRLGKHTMKQHSFHAFPESTESIYFSIQFFVPLLKLFIIIFHFICLTTLPLMWRRRRLLNFNITPGLFHRNRTMQFTLVISARE